MHYLRTAAVCERYGISRSTLTRWVKAQIFPAPQKLGPRAIGWEVKDLDKHDSDRLAAQSQSDK